MVTDLLLSKEIKDMVMRPMVVSKEIKAMVMSGQWLLASIKGDCRRWWLERINYRRILGEKGKK